MVKYNSDPQLDLTFHALADPTRRQILGLIAHKNTCTVTELAKPFDMSLAAVSKHLNVLRRAGLVHRHVRGRTHYCTLDVTPLKDAEQVITYLKKYWEQQFDSLEKFLVQMSEDKPQKKEKKHDNSTARPKKKL